METVTQAADIEERYAALTATVARAKELEQSAPRLTLVDLYRHLASQRGADRARARTTTTTTTRSANQ